jgi:hypothetical protein
VSEESPARESSKPPGWVKWPDDPLALDDIALYAGSDIYRWLGISEDPTHQRLRAAIDELVAALGEAQPDPGDPEANTYPLCANVRRRYFGPSSDYCRKL